MKLSLPPTQSTFWANHCLLLVSLLLWICTYFFPNITGISYQLPHSGRMLLFPEPTITAIWFLCSLVIPILAALITRSILRSSFTTPLQHGSIRAIWPLLFLPLTTLFLPFRLYFDQQLVANLPFYSAVAIFSFIILRLSELNNSRETPDKTLSHRLIALFTLFFLLFYWLTGWYFTKASGEHSGDEGHYLIQAKSLHEDGDLDLINNFDPDERKLIDRGDSYYLHISPTSHEGKYHSWHPFGLPVYLSLAPPDNFAYRHLLLGLFSGLGSAGLLLLCSMFSVRKNTAIVFVTLTSLSALWGIYSVRALPELPGAVLGIWIAVALLSARKKPWVAGILIIVCCGYLPFLHQRFVPISFFGYLFFSIHLLCGKDKARFWRAFFFTTAGLTVCALVYLYVNAQLYTTAVGYVSSQFILYPDGALDVLFSNNGITYVLPSFFWILAAVIVSIAWRGNSYYLSFAMLTFTSVLILSCTNMGWTGGASTYGRYLVAVYPLFIPIAAWVYDRTNGIARWWFVFLSCISPLYFFFLLLRLPAFQANFGDPRHFIGVVYEYFTGLFDPFPIAEKMLSNTFFSAESILFPLFFVIATSLLLVPKRNSSILYIIPLSIVLFGSVSHHSQKLSEWDTFDYRKKVFTQRGNAENWMQFDLNKSLFLSQSPKSASPLYSVSNLFSFDHGKNLQSVTTDESDRNTADNILYQPEMAPNDWSGKRIFWTTLGKRFRAGKNPSAFHLSGKLSAETSLHLVVIEMGGTANHVLYDETFPAEQENREISVHQIVQPQGDGYVHILIRIPDGTGTFISDSLDWSPFSTEMLKHSMLSLPEQLTENDT